MARGFNPFKTSSQNLTINDIYRNISREGKSLKNIIINVC